MQSTTYIDQEGFNVWNSNCKLLNWFLVKKKDFDWGIYIWINVDHLTAINIFVGMHSTQLITAFRLLICKLTIVVL